MGMIVCRVFKGEIFGIKQEEDGPDEENKGWRRANLALWRDCGGRACFVDTEEGHNVGTGGEHVFVGTKEGSNVSVAYPVTLHPC